jgi:hypothetical protein
MKILETSRLGVRKWGEGKISIFKLRRMYVVAVCGLRFFQLKAINIVVYL